MSNIHPLFKPILASLTPPARSKRAYLVTLRIRGFAPEDHVVQAYNSCDAIVDTFNKVFGDAPLVTTDFHVHARPAPASNDALAPEAA